jgi:Zn-dependent protease
MAAAEIAQTDPAAARSILDNLFRELWRGMPYGGAIMLILGAHEAGHYIMIRRHGVASTLPYFIPMPFIEINPFGIFGAAIGLKGPIRNRKHLLDIGVAGPLAGMIFAIPILLIGLATSPIIVPTGGPVEGNSVLYAMAKLVVFGQFLPNPEADVLVNQLAWAGWTGLFVTSLNLLPLGQLDGGHVLYALFGDYARRFFMPLIATVVFLLLFVSSLWAILLVLLLLVGRYYAVPLDTITRLDKRRRWVAISAILLFVATFVPNPLSMGGVAQGILALVVGLVMLRRLNAIGCWLSHPPKGHR